MFNCSRERSRDSAAGWKCACHGMHAFPLQFFYNFSYQAHTVFELAGLKPGKKARFELSPQNKPLVGIHPFSLGLRPSGTPRRTLKLGWRGLGPRRPSGTLGEQIAETVLCLEMWRLLSFNAVDCKKDRSSQKQ